MPGGNRPWSMAPDDDSHPEDEVADRLLVVRVVPDAARVTSPDAAPAASGASRVTSSDGSGVRQCGQAPDVSSIGAAQ